MLMLAVCLNWNTLKRKKTTPSIVLLSVKTMRVGKTFDAADVRSARACARSERRHDEKSIRAR